MDKSLLSYINWGLLACMLLLYLVGVGNLYSASGTRVETGLAFNSFYQRQIIWGLCGLACMLLAMAFDYRQLRNLAWPFFFLTMLLLLLVPIAGKTVYGAKRWLSLGFMSVQPSELAKLSVLVLAARLLARDGLPLGWKDFIAIVFICVLPCALIVIQPDLGTTMLILLILAGMILFHGLKGYVFKTCLLAVPCFGAFMWFVGMHDYQRQRILTFLDPTTDPRGTGYHIIQSQIAIGSGGVFGKGWMNGSQGQLEFLPERSTDFIFAVIGEEFGLVGLVLLVLLYLFVVGRAIYLAMQTQETFARLLAGSLAMTFFVYVFINAGMVSGLLPVVGVPLPLVSYGGTSMVTLLAGFGILMSLYSHRKLIGS